MNWRRAKEAKNAPPRVGAASQLRAPAAHVESEWGQDDVHNANTDEEHNDDEYHDNCDDDDEQRPPHVGAATYQAQALEDDYGDIITDDSGFNIY